MDVSTIINIINTIGIVICCIVLFSQNNIITRMRSFIDIIDVNKLKESTNYIIEGEKIKFQTENSILKRMYDTEIESKNALIKSLQDDFHKSKSESDRKYLFFKLLSLNNASLSNGYYKITLNLFTLLSIIDFLKSNNLLKSDQFSDKIENLREQSNQLSSNYIRLGDLYDLFLKNPDEASNQITEINSRVNTITDNVDQIHKEISEIIDTVLRKIKG